jgi:hypothetical protein
LTLTFEPPPFFSQRFGIDFVAVRIAAKASLRSLEIVLLQRATLFAEIQTRLAAIVERTRDAEPRRLAEEEWFVRRPQFRVKPDAPAELQLSDEGWTTTRIVFVGT